MLDQKYYSILKQYWGFTSFRPIQEEVIAAVLSKPETLALMPTGGGKSLCFQVPAMAKEGVCIVITPLIALMKDQVSNLRKKGIEAYSIYSGLPFREIDRILDNVVYGQVKFIYISPERLENELFRTRLQKMKCCLIAVDEAHCISQWGYDFRPSYLNINELRTFFPEVSLIALTATATNRVAEDIQKQLAFKKENVIRQSFFRHNLTYFNIWETNKEQRLLQVLKRMGGSSVVYVRNRKKTIEVAKFLNQHQIKAGYYHAGMTLEERSTMQDEWMKDKIDCMVSTNAFGMGIDKPNVRVVVHLSVPPSLEDYFQEAGRAGRDGNPAFAVLLIESDDIEGLKDNLKTQFPPLELVRQCYFKLCNIFQIAIGAGKEEVFEFDIQDFSKKMNLSSLEVWNSIKVMERAGYLEFQESGFVPSMLQFLVDRTQLYDFQLKNRKFQHLIDTLLRLYPHITNQMVVISERKIAEAIKIPYENLKFLLLNLKNEKIVDYQLNSNKPKIIFLKERVDIRDLDLNLKLYEFRKKRAENQTERVIHYLESSICRSVLLLDYFDEKGTPCGKCDVCLSEKKPVVTEEERALFLNRIIEIVKREKVSPEELISRFSILKKELVSELIHHLITERVLLENQGILQYNFKAR